MGELSQRRAQKKAQTRAHIRAVAQRLFAAHGFDGVTTADVARHADVAVQTVFNHFSTKEELFFDGRTPWVSGPAEAVRDRGPDTCPLDALRVYLVDQVRSLIDATDVAERQSYLRTIEASDVLPVRERELVFESEQRLTAALRDAWTACDRTDPGTTPRDPEVAAAVTAAMWLAAVRALIVGHRTLVAGGRDACAVARELGELVDRLLAGLARSAEHLRGEPAEPTRTPARLRARRAG
ncbi:TetR/AcrR family transcriptional regulator [Blastococcus saxobsidens]|uniref:TetR family transcriptional regulator n=1 Tax=Blastococcus saxobsidens TaxID=138336 RepID=A0A4Q7YAJ8_9ACTN|nr:TetR/AcrR family transcriptional regulator [Blastococcus saxobsidens]RZU34060.1 TetR family transcriptional regulator [Blastococcus saxobsidens]